MFRPLSRVRAWPVEVNHGRSRVLLARAVLAALALALLLPPQSESQSADYQIAGGWFYTQTGGDTPDPFDGYAVVDDPQARFWTAFVDLGGVQAVGYPVTQRFNWDGFVTQVFQKAAFQWRADTGKVEFINVFDDLNRLGFDDALEARLIPGQEQFQEAGLDFDEITARRIALLDAEPALRARYESVGDPLRWFGLPQSQVREYSNGLLRSIRLQRAVLQLWTEDVPWASAGTVTVANGGEEAKALGMWPADAAKPVKAPAPAMTSSEGATGARPDYASPIRWEYPLPDNDYPYSTYRVVIDDGVAIVRIGGSEFRALDVFSGEALWEISDSNRFARWEYRAADGAVYLLRFREPSHADQYANRGLGPTSDVLAFDVRTGEKLWHFWDVPPYRFQRIRLRDQILAVDTFPRIGLDIRTGAKIWELHVSGFANFATGGRIFFEHADVITAASMSDGTILWRRELPDLSQLRAANADRLFANSETDGGAIVAIDAETGLIAWTYEQTGRILRITGSNDEVVVVESSFRPSSQHPTIVPSDDVCALESRTGSVVWCRDLAEGSANIHRQGDYLRLGDGVRTVLIDPSSGNELWGHELELDGVAVSPQVLPHGGDFYQLVRGEVSLLGGPSQSVIWRFESEWGKDPSDRSDRPYLMAAVDGIVIVWTGSGLAAVGAHAA